VDFVVSGSSFSYAFTQTLSASLSERTLHRHNFALTRQINHMARELCAGCSDAQLSLHMSLRYASPKRLRRGGGRGKGERMVCV